MKMQQVPSAELFAGWSALLLLRFGGTEKTSSNEDGIWKLTSM